MRIPDALRGQVFRGSEALAEGLISRRGLTRVARRLFRDVYADSAIDPTHAVRCHALQRLVLPDAVITGASAAYLYGIRIVADDADVEVVLPVPHGPVKGVLAHHGPLRPGDVGDRAVTTPARACWDLLLHRRWDEAMIFVDQFLRTRLVTSSALAAYAWSRHGERGWRRMLKAAQVADGGAESPAESRIRLRLIGSGIPSPVTQYAIAEAGARTDMAWPDYKVALEYEGYAHHSAPSDLARDRARLNRLAAAGWIVIHVTAGQRPERIVAEVLTALRSRGWPGPPTHP